jgi:hypothetical protein
MMAIAGNRMNTIQRTSRTLRAFFILLAILLPAERSSTAESWYT